MDTRGWLVMLAFPVFPMCVDDMTSFRTVSVQSAQLVKEGRLIFPGQVSTFFSIIASSPHLFGFLNWVSFGLLAMKSML